jgi:hypothetical protein
VLREDLVALKGDAASLIEHTKSGATNTSIADDALLVGGSRFFQQQTALSLVAALLAGVVLSGKT